MATTPLDSATRTADAAPRHVFVNNFVALLLGTGLMLLVHEMGHWLTGAAFGYKSTMFPFAANAWQDMTTQQRVLTTAAGPLVSLLLGALLVTWQPLRRLANFWHLLWLWFGFTSLQEAVTYLVITPFGAGDTAEIREALNLPFWVAIVACVIGVAGMFLTAWLFARAVRRHTGGERRAANSMSFFPWLASLPFTMGLPALYVVMSNSGVTTGQILIIVLAGMATGVFAPMAMMFVNRVKTGRDPLHITAIPWVGIVLYVALVAFNLFLTRGLTIGG